MTTMFTAYLADCEDEMFVDLTLHATREAAEASFQEMVDTAYQFHLDSTDKPFAEMSLDEIKAWMGENCGTKAEGGIRTDEVKP